MNSLEWRVRNLEEKLVSGITSDQELPICDQLNRVAQLYKKFCESDGQNYARFVELYEKHKRLLSDLESTNNQISDIAKAELVLDHEEDLIKHLEDVVYLSNKADKVLDQAAWPDLSNYTERLDKLEPINREQHLQSIKLDKRTEELIDIYNDIITSFDNNIVIWNQRLEAYENEERKADQDE